MSFVLLTWWHREIFVWGVCPLSTTCPCHVQVSSHLGTTNIHQLLCYHKTTTIKYSTLNIIFFVWLCNVSCVDILFIRGHWCIFIVYSGINIVFLFPPGNRPLSDILANSLKFWRSSYNFIVKCIGNCCQCYCKSSKIVKCHELFRGHQEHWYNSIL